MKSGFLSGLTLAVFMLAGGVPSAVAGQDESFRRSLTVEQQTIHDVGAGFTTTQDGDDALKVVAWVDRGDYTYAIGEPVRIYVETNKDAYVTVLNTDSAGQTTQLFPNQYQPDNFVSANRAMEVPDPASRSRIVVTGNVGDELLKVVASTSPVSLFEARQLSDAGGFRVVRTDAQRTARSLSVVMDDQRPAGGSVTTPPAGLIPVSAGSDTGWAVCHQKIRTLAVGTLASRTRSLEVRTNDSGDSVRCEE